MRKEHDEMIGAKITFALGLLMMLAVWIEGSNLPSAVDFFGVVASAMLILYSFKQAAA